VFLARHGGTPRLYVRRLDRLESETLAGTDNADNPFFSPDGKWVGFFADGKLKKVSVVGGTPVILCDAPAGATGAWAPDDSIIFALSTWSGLMRVPAAGGTPQPFTRLDTSKGEKTHHGPEILPGGKAVVYGSGSPDGRQWDWTIAVATLKTGEVKTLPIRSLYARYIRGGYLAFERQEGLFVVPFDLQRLEVTGSPFPILQEQGFAFSETGSLAYVPRGATLGNLAWVDRKGVVEPLGTPTRDYGGRVQLSPDGKHVVLVIETEGSYDVWTYELAHGALTRFTLGDGDSVAPAWSPDGRRIAFSRYEGGNISIVAEAVDGSGIEETLLPAQTRTIISFIQPASWSPDGRFLVYGQTRSGKREIWVLPLEGERKPRALLANQFDNWAALFSPDGKYLAYVSNETGRSEVYVMPFGNGTGKWQISTGGADVAVWGRDGKQLFYRESGNIMGVDVRTQPVFTASTPRVIVPAKATVNLKSDDMHNFEVSPDGQRFLIHQQSEGSKTPQINVVLNWSEELKRMAPAGKQP
jgi:serine/threonine-protein kinase